MKHFELETLGCKVNEYESAFYTEILEKAGYQPIEKSPDPNTPVDLIVVNTCTVTNTAAAKSRRRIGRLRREHPEAFVVVVGCYPQTLSKEEREALGVDLILGAAHKNELVERIEQARQGKENDLVENIADLTQFEDMPIGLFEGQHRAFLKIQDGCNQYCTYCQIPLARGPERSQIPEKVVESAKGLVNHGHLEIVLTGIHTGRYHFRQTNLVDLLKLLLDNTPLEVCYRLSSIEVTEVSDELLDLMAHNPRILPHLHIPIQAGDDRTLARMHRPYSVAQFKERLGVIRQKVPNISISTDVITGFVGESDEEFETTKQTLQDCAFSFLHVFPYSRRKGTQADQMDGFVNGTLVKERTNSLLALSKTLRQADMERFTTSQMLVEREDPNHPGWYIGYTAQYHPIQIQSDTNLHGRIHVKMTAIENERYIAHFDAK